MSRRRRRSPARRGNESENRIRLREPADLIAMVPYLLGFHPRDSVVAVFFADKRLLLTARLDLAAVPNACDLATHLGRLRRHVKGNRQVVLGYGTSPTGRAILTSLAEQSGAETAEVLWVGPDRWWSLSCAGACCPSEGTPYDLSSHPVTAEAVLAGMAAAADRSSLESLVRGPDDDDLPELRRLVAQSREEVEAWDLRERKRQMADLVRSALERAQPLPRPDIALLAVLATDVQVRDIAWSLITRPDAADHVTLWSQVVRLAPDEVASAPLCLLGIAAWQSGRGALLNCCIARMEAVDPGYSMLRICADISEQAVPPSAWDAVAEEFRAEVGMLTR